MGKTTHPLGIVVALSVEARTLARRSLAPGRPVCLGGGVTVLCGGLGPRWARWAAGELVRSGARGLVSWGTAAALDASLEPGALLLPNRVVGLGPADLPVDAGWRCSLGRILTGRIAYRDGPLAHADGVLRGPEDKRDLFARTAALGADMESAGVAEVASDAGVAFLAVRAVSDGAHHRVPHAASRAVGRDGGIRAGRFLVGWLRDPAETPAILGLVMGFRAARRTLAGVAEAAGPRLGMS